MTKMEWTGRRRAYVGTVIAVLLVLGLTGMVRFPAVMTVTCTTDWELRAAE